jgi:hypothetical protein
MTWIRWWTWAGDPPKRSPPTRWSRAQVGDAALDLSDVMSDDSTRVGLSRGGQSDGCACACLQELATATSGVPALRWTWGR